MSIILSIETSTFICSIALHENGIIKAQAELYLEKSHSGSLAKLIEELLAHCEYNMEQLSAIAVSSGPGSYTGLRIGMSTAKGLCYALDIPLLGVSSLNAMALQVNHFFVNDANYLLIPMIDARRMEVYYKCLTPDLSEEKKLGNLILQVDTFDQLLTKYEKLVLFGNGADKAEAMYAEKRNLKIIKDVTPEAKYLGVLGYQKFERNEFENLAYFEPSYGKEFYSPESKKKPFVIF